MSIPRPGQPFSHLMVALPCEAKPLIRRYRLSRVLDEPAFPIYRNESITLTVTGIGKTAMAAGAAYTNAIFDRSRGAVWLNVGVAGHRDLAVGEACLAHKITDRDRLRSWYPSLIAAPPCGTETLVTWSRPETRYEDKALYDMEASGFYETASRFSTAELIQCLKVVSDNRASPADALRADFVAELIEQHVGLVEILLQQQNQLAALVTAPSTERFERFIGRWHFSVQQRFQLQSLLHRWALLDPEHCPEPEQLSDLKNGREVLVYLRDKVGRLALVF
jgi:adenosylhomocysteine nucleosidase